MRKFRVLVVDDNPDMQWILTATLERSGIDTSLACDGIEALEALSATNLPDAVVTDIDMPNLNGLRLVERMSADPRLSLIPVVLASALPRSSTPDVFGTIDKPFSAEAFVTLVRRACLAGEARRRKDSMLHDQ